VLIGDGAGSREVMQRIAATSGCGFATDYAALNTPQGMANFVKKVFLKAAVDSDGDGVYDQFDHCPDTPRGVKVDKNGCPLSETKTIIDSDHDGVPDSADLCPDTPQGIKVDKDGCPLPITTPQTIELQVLFGFDKDSVRPMYHTELAHFAKFMKAHPEISVTLQGYTDNVGTKAYNQALSLRRAVNVKRYLESNFGVNPARLKTAGYGFSQPVASNNTANGRQKNRRVYATLSVQ
ncbi:MAG TPA: OmpA family protein, partial [Desulfobacterales bacterium]|nr:OmpA family protein [Desulfobacterales bacterium]